MVLSQKLSYKDIMWIDPNSRILEEWKEKILELREDKDYGYIIDRDLEYPKEFHNEHKDLLLAPEHYNKRLCTSLFDKKDYVVNSRKFKYYLQKGMILKHINKVISFKQKDFMTKYIDFNTKIRAKSRSDSKKYIHNLNTYILLKKTDIYMILMLST